MTNPVEAHSSKEDSQDQLSLVERNKDNLSLYSFEEEVQELLDVAEEVDFPCEVVAINHNGIGFGYLVLPQDQQLQRQIIAEAPITMMDFDDTQAHWSAGGQ